MRVALLFISTFLILSPKMYAEAGSYAIVRCRQPATTGFQNSTQYFILDSAHADNIKVSPEGLITVTGHKAEFQDVADPSASGCSFTYREMARVCKPLQRPACQIEPVLKTSTSNMVKVESSPGLMIQTCAVGSSVESFEDSEAWLDALHKAKYPPPRLVVNGTRLDPLKRECLIH